MKVAPSTFAPGPMIFLAVSFVLVIGLFAIWPKSAGDGSKGYTDDGTAVQGDTIKLPGSVEDGGKRPFR